MFEAKKRLGLGVLDYRVTSNHIRLLVKDMGVNVIAESMQLIGSRTAQEYMGDVYALREESEAYTRNSTAENEVLSTENTFLWNENVDDSGT